MPATASADPLQKAGCSEPGFPFGENQLPQLSVERAENQNSIPSRYRSWKIELAAKSTVSACRASREESSIKS